MTLLLEKVLGLAEAYGIPAIDVNFDRARLCYLVGAGLNDTPPLRSATLRAIRRGCVSWGGSLTGGVYGRNQRVLILSHDPRDRYRRDAVFATDALHELCHLVLGPASVEEETDELPLLIPLETELAHYISGQVPTELAREFLEEVRSVQDDGDVAVYFTDGWLSTVPLRNLSGIRSSDYWQDKVAWLVELGVLDVEGRPGRVLGDAESRRVADLAAYHSPTRDQDVSFRVPRTVTKHPQSDTQTGQ
jgi:hypothetical protein